MTMNLPPATSYYPEHQPSSTLRSLGQQSFGRRNTSINHNHNINNINNINVNQSIPYNTSSLPRTNVIRGISSNRIAPGYVYQSNQSQSHNHRPSLQGRSGEYDPVRSNVQYVQPQYVQPQYIQPQYVQPQYIQPQFIQPQHYRSQPVYYQSPHHIHTDQHYPSMQQYYSPSLSPIIPTTYMPHPSRLSPSTLNNNFSYQQANFDVSYKIQQNKIHCILCNQSYLPEQKSQHLLKHRKKINSINIRPIDQQQLKRLEKYNQIIKPKGFIIKPIVQPEEFNVQYKTNQYVLKRINQYKDEEGPRRNQIAIQADSRINENLLTSQLLGYNRSINNNQNSSRSNHQNSPRSIHQQPIIIQQQHIDIDNNNNNNNNNPRITNNTRFNDDSLRVQQQIEYQSSRYRQSKQQKQTLNNNNKIGYSSYRQSQHPSNMSRISSSLSNTNYKNITYNNNNNLGYVETPNNNEFNFEAQQQQTKLKYRPVQSYNQVDEQSLYRNSKKSNNNTLEKINEEEEFKNFTANLGYN